MILMGLGDFFRRSKKQSTAPIGKSVGKSIGNDDVDELTTGIYASHLSVLSMLPKDEREEFQAAWQRFCSSYPPNSEDERIVMRVMTATTAQNKNFSEKRKKR
jgi:hypothetical protein